MTAGSRRDETKNRYLTQAAELVRRPLVAGVATFPFAVAHVTIADVAAAMGVTRPQLYKLWPSRYDYWEDLTYYISLASVDPDNYQDTDFDTGATADIEDVLDFTRLALNEIQTEMLTDPFVLLRTSLVGYTDGTRLTNILAAADRQGVAAIEEKIVAVCRQVGREVVPPLTILDVAVVLFCMADGLSALGRLSGRVSDARIDLDGTGERLHGLYAYVGRTVLLNFLQPRTSDASVIDRPDVTRPLKSPAPDWSSQQIAALSVGHRLFLEQRGSAVHSVGDATGGPLGYVSIAQLASAAKVSRQAINKIWPTQEAFRIDLLRHLHRTQADLFVQAAKRSIRSIGRRGRPALLPAVEAIVNWHAVADPNEPLSHLAFASAYQNSAVRDAGGREVEATLDGLSAALAAAFKASHLQLRPGVAVDHIAGLLKAAALVVGRVHRTDPELLRTQIPFRGGAYSAFAIVVEAVIDSSLETPT